MILDTLKNIKKWLVGSGRSHSSQPARHQTHAELISQLLSNSPLNSDGAYIVETGCGLSTLAFAEAGASGQCSIFSCDYNQEKVDALKARSGSSIDHVNFLLGNSIENLQQLSKQLPRIDFLFLDSAASAMHTFNEFLAVEKLLVPGSILLIDNAALPGETHLLSPVRKGKILVPYLLASPYWTVTGHPGAGDSMVSAMLTDQPVHADPSHEDPEYIDMWQDYFASNSKQNPASVDRI